MKFFAANDLSASITAAPKAGKTLGRNVLPIPFVEFDLCFGRLFDQHFDIFRPERGVSTQQNVCNYSSHASSAVSQGHYSN